MAQRNSNIMAIKKDFQSIILTLHRFWAQQGCAILQPYDIEVGAGTFHWATALYALGPRDWRAAYAQACRRPADGRYGDNPNRLQHYYQYQVLLKPSPADSRELYLASLAEIGIDSSQHDIRFIEDDWESPTLGAWGLGWEVWCDGMEVSQFTYFQQIGGIDCSPSSTKITYGLERLAMHVQGVDNVYELDYNGAGLTYGDIFHENERQFSKYNFELADAKKCLQHFAEAEAEAEKLIKAQLALPAYDFCLKANHQFNLLDAGGSLGVSERQAYILRIRDLVRQIAELWVSDEEKRAQTSKLAG